MPYKNIIIILSIILLLLTAVLLIYYLFFKDTVPEPVPTSNNDQQSDIQPTPAAKLKPLTPSSAVCYVADGQNIKYIDAVTGQILQTNLTSQEAQLANSLNTSKIFKGIWSQDSSQVIYSTYNNNTVENFHYHLNSQQLNNLSQNIEAVSFSPDSDQIVYQYTNANTDTSNISIALPNGSNWQNIIDLSISDINIYWPAHNLVAILTKPSGLAAGTLLGLNPATKELKIILKDKYGLSVLWSPQGDKILYLETDKNGKNPYLKVADNNGQDIIGLDVATLPDKCAWSQNNHTIYCAVTGQFPENTILPDDYYMGLFASQDQLWSIDIDSRQKGLILSLEDTPADLDAYNLQLNSQESHLFFINKKDGRIYSLEL